MLFLTECCLLLVLVLGWASRTVSGLSLGTSSIPDNKINLSCFKSSDPEAVTATQLHGEGDSNGYLWSRASNATDRLPPCSTSSFSPPPSLCDVCCFEDVVYIICNNLPPQHMYLERPGQPFSSKQSDCPRLQPAGTTSITPSGATGAARPGGRFGLYASLVFITVLLLLLFIWSACKKTPVNESNNVSNCPLSSSVGINVPENGHAGHSAE